VEILIDSMMMIIVITISVAGGRGGGQSSGHRKSKIHNFAAAGAGCTS
jgi:hypothetical protein